MGSLEDEMPRVAFTPNLARHVPVPTLRAEGSSVGAVLARVFSEHPRARGYVLDDQGGLRKHVMVFVNGEQVIDRRTLSDPVGEDDEIYVMQALSGG